MAHTEIAHTRVAAASKRRQSHACATSPTQSHEAAAGRRSAAEAATLSELSRRQANAAAEKACTTSSCIGNAAKPCATLATESRESAAGGRRRRRRTLGDYRNSASTCVFYQTSKYETPICLTKNLQTLYVRRDDCGKGIQLQSLFRRRHNRSSAKECKFPTLVLATTT